MFRGKPIFALALGAAMILGTGCPSSGGGGGGSTPTATPADSSGNSGNGGDTAAKMGNGVIEGSVAFTGTAPRRKKLRRGSDPFCAKTEKLDEKVIVTDGKLANVVVRVVKGAEGTYEPKPVEVDQHECMYDPRVQVAMDGAEVTIKNTDETLHNVHVYQGKKTLFNKAQPPNSAALEQKFSDGGEIIKFACDVHPWMAGYLALSPNPFFAVSGEDGSFKIEHLPAGTYTLEAWHEAYGMKTAEVTVTEEAPATVEFSYSGSETAMN